MHLRVVHVPARRRCSARCRSGNPTRAIPASSSIHSSRPARKSHSRPSRIASCGNAARASSTALDVSRQLVDAACASRRTSPASGCDPRSRVSPSPSSTARAAILQRPACRRGGRAACGCGNRRATEEHREACSSWERDLSRKIRPRQLRSLAAYRTLDTRRPAEEHSRAMRFIESVFQKLKRHPKRIVFPGRHRAAGPARRRALCEASTRRARRARSQGRDREGGRSRRRSASITSGSSTRRRRRSCRSSAAAREAEALPRSRPEAGRRRSWSTRTTSAR